MHEKRADFYLIFVMALAAIGSGYQLFWSDDRPAGERSGTPLASISSFNNTVKTKSGTRIAWRDASVKETLYGGDQIYTHDHSDVEISFSDKTKVSLLENSLFKITVENEKPTLDLKSGLIYIKFSNKKSNFKLKLGKRQIEINSKNAEVQISKEAGTAKILLVKGGAEIKEKDNKVELEENQLINLSKSRPINELAVLNVTLLGPAAQSVIYVSNNRPIEFEWFKTDKISSTRLEIAKDRSFKQIIHQREYQIDSVKLEKLEKGHYYWRIVYEATELKQAGFSEIRSFELRQDHAPTLIGPTDKSGVFLDPESNRNELNINWIKKGASKFQLELKNENGIKMVDSIGTNLLLKGPLLGKLSLRVRSHPEERKDSPWSKLYSIDIKMLQLPGEVTVDFPSENQKVTIPEDGIITFKWKQDAHSKGHVWYLSRQKDFKELTLKKFVEGAEFDWTGQGRGGFYWKVNAIDQLGRERVSSKYHQFTLYSPPVKVLGPLAFSFLSMKRPDSPLTFKWQGRNSGRFLIQIAKSKEFLKTLVNRELVGGQFEWTSGAPGKYYWRIKELFSTEESQFTEAQYFEIKKTAPPKAPSFKNIPSKFNIEVEVDEEGGFSVLDLFISPVHAQKIKSSVTLRWDEQENAKEYLLEIYSDPQMKKGLLKTNITGPEYKWQDPIRGKVYWRLAVKDHWGQVSGFSGPFEAEMVMPKKWRPLKSPYLVYPKHGKKIDFESKSESKTFKWAGDSRAKEYTFKISKTLNFEKPLVEKTVSKNQTSVNIKKLKGGGQFYWRVVAVDRLGRTKKSRRRRLNFLSANPVLAAQIKKEVKRERIKLVKKKTYFKKIEKERTDYLKISQNPTVVNYELKQGRLNVVFDGMVLSSTEIEYFNKLKKKDFLLANLKRTTGEALETLKYSDLTLQASWNRYTHWGQDFPLYYSYGALANKGTAFKRKSVDEIEVTSNTSFGLKLGLGGHTSAFWSTTQHFQVYLAAGSLTAYGASWSLRYKWSKNLFFTSGIAINSTSFETSEKAEVSVSEMKASLGAGYYFF